MKKKYICILLLISLLINVYQFIKPQYNRSSKAPVASPTVTCLVTDNSDNSIGYLSYIFMNNPIDNYFVNQLKHPKSEVDYESTEQTYCKIWEQEYKKILDIIRKKCKYSEDKDIFSKYNKYSQKVYNNSKEALLTVMLDNFLIEPGTPEKNSWGLGTSEQLELHKGMFYRNQCILFIPYLENEYSFPTTESLEHSIKSIIRSCK